MAAELPVGLFRKGQNAEPIPPEELLDVLSKLKPVKDEFPDIDRGLGELDEVNIRPNA